MQLNLPYRNATVIPVLIPISRPDTVVKLQLVILWCLVPCCVALSAMTSPAAELPGPEELSRLSELSELSLSANALTSVCMAYDALNTSIRDNKIERGPARTKLMRLLAEARDEYYRAGGRYIWVYDPASELLVYYAHNSELSVKLGEIVRPGDVLATVGRSGYNAAKRRSPTHLHLTVLRVRDGQVLPMDIYQNLKQARFLGGGQEPGLKSPQRE